MPLYMLLLFIFALLLRFYTHIMFQNNIVPKTMFTWVMAPLQDWRGLYPPLISS